MLLPVPGPVPTRASVPVAGLIPIGVPQLPGEEEEEDDNEEGG